jgi:UDP-GlcNAc:undecaprenyl-phosphate GlcNAc-1-phosphate transferase
MFFGLSLPLAFVCALLPSLLAARLLTRVPAGRRELDVGRHFHVGYIPRLGGVAVFVGLLVGTAVAMAASAFQSGSLPVIPGITSVLTAAAILFVTGLVDDLKGIPAIGKIIAQTVAALIVCGGGFQLQAVSIIPGHVMYLGWLALPITVLWLVGVSNAFNLVDGLDGLSGGVALVGLLAASACAMILGDRGVTIYAVALSGALLGFLRFNFPRARIFLGDSGALVVGFLLALLTVKGATRSDGVILGIAPIFALSYPLLDTGVAILRRWLRGVPLARGDRRHIHHQLHALGFSPTRSVIIIYLWALFIAALGVSATFAPPIVTGMVAISGGAILIALFGFGFRFLDYHEFHEAGSSLASVLRHARLVIQDRINARDIAVVLSLAETRAEVEAILEDSAELFRFARMKLAGAHGNNTPGSQDIESGGRNCWKLEYPIVEDSSAGASALYLTIWCPAAIGSRTAGPEQIAHILAPSIAEAIRRTKSVKSFQHQGSRAGKAEKAGEASKKIGSRGVSVSA